MRKWKLVVTISMGSLIAGICYVSRMEADTNPVSTTPEVKPSLNVLIIQAQIRELPMTLMANGSIAAWQEAIVGAEVSDLHLRDVRVQVGEGVKKGQLLAKFEDETVAAEVAHYRSLLAETEAQLDDARRNAERAQRLGGKGALSHQQLDQYMTSEKSAKAKMQSAKAQLDLQLLRLKYTQVLASDDGVISSRSATLGSVASKGQELFRMIRQNRLEWRGELTASEMAKIKPGLTVTVNVPDVGSIAGSVRALAPTLDAQNRNGLVYVDIPHAAEQGLRAGMFAKGEFQLAINKGLMVPQDAVSLREGFNYVFRLDKPAGDLARVNQIKVELGRQVGNDLEIRSGIKPEDRLVASGVTFLSDGDTVKLVKP